MVATLELKDRILFHDQNNRWNTGNFSHIIVFLPIITITNSSQAWDHQGPRHAARYGYEIRIYIRLLAYAMGWLYIFGEKFGYL